jgi:DNA invertase Pin-like site-specific DNA recombinase
MSFVVWRLDRWGRSLSDVLQSLQELRTLKVDFVSLTEGLDFIRGVIPLLGGLGIFAEFERDVLRERVRARRELPAQTGKERRLREG